MGQRLRFLIAIFIMLTILLPSSFFSAGQNVEEDSDNPIPDINCAAQEDDWAYYFQLPISLILIFILMVAMLIYVRRNEE